MSLTAEQQQVIDSPAKHKKVIAGAGTGKTTLLVAQVRDWLKSGVDPKTTTAITFTRKAGEHLRSKIGRDLGYIGTIHSWCYVMLRAWGCRWVLLDDRDLAAVIKFVLQSAKIESICNSKRILEGLTGKKACKKDSDKLGEKEVLAYMTNQGLIYVDWLLNLFVSMCLKHDRFRIMARVAAQTIMWDEFQDSNEAEAQILRILAPDRSFVIGDWRQAIYQFRGSSEQFLIDHGMSMDKDFSSHLLTMNWRSLPDIVAMGNAVHSGCSTGLLPMRSSLGKKTITETEEESTLDFVAKVADLSLEVEGKIGILARNNSTLRAVYKELESLLPGKSKICHRDHDPYAGPTWRKLYNACRFALDPTCDWVAHELLSEHVGLDLTFNYMETSYWDMVKDRAPSWAHELTTDNATARAEDLRIAMGLELIGGRPELAFQTLAEFCAWYIKRSLEDDLVDAEDAPRILLMTIHGSKGLEFETVVFINPDPDPKTPDESNVKYVGITRAMNQLWLANVPELLPLWERKWS